ncbi:MAG: IPT/TIG domain-containing protein [Kofleriaceae bacterium]
MRRLRIAILALVGALVALAACAANEDIPAPQVASIVPDHASAGAIVMIAGSYFCQRPDNGQEDPTCDSAGSVDFGTVPGVATTWADDAIMVEVPHASGEVDVSVTAAGRISNSASFTIE